MIPAGTYPIGHRLYPHSRPEHEVTLADYVIGEYAITNGQYSEFIAAGGYGDQSLWSEAGWRWQEHKQTIEPGLWHDPNFNHEWQPVVGVCWYEADAFAGWLTRESGLPWRLPSEVEWEAAARGTEAEPFLNPAHINSVERGIDRTWGVMAGAGVTWCGAHDMLGNVWEWTSSRWGRNWQSLDYPYPYDPADGREDPSGSYARVMRGGSWFDPLSQAHPANRARYLPGSRGSNIGFRLARSVH
jgi:formylglycine-generating enzyme required for sulfatase activity